MIVFIIFFGKSRSYLHPRSPQVFMKEFPLCREGIISCIHLIMVLMPKLGNIRYNQAYCHILVFSVFSCWFVFPWMLCLQTASSLPDHKHLLLAWQAETLPPSSLALLRKCSKDNHQDIPCFSKFQTDQITLINWYMNVASMYNNSYSTYDIQQDPGSEENWVAIYYNTCSRGARVQRAPIQVIPPPV